MWTGYKHVIVINKDDDSKESCCSRSTITKRYNVFAETHIPKLWSFASDHKAT